MPPHRLEIKGLAEAGSQEQGSTMQGQKRRWVPPSMGKWRCRVGAWGRDWGWVHALLLIPPPRTQGTHPLAVRQGSPGVNGMQQTDLRRNLEINTVTSKELGHPHSR